MSLNTDLLNIEDCVMLIDNAKSVRNPGRKNRFKKIILFTRQGFQIYRDVHINFVFYVNIYVSKVIVTLGNLHKKMILKCI